MHSYLLKGDISGIQSFIFDTPTKGAAKVLKSRSQWVEELTQTCYSHFKQHFPSSEKVYLGGGNFFLEITTDDPTAIDRIIHTIQQKHLTDDLFPVFAYVAKAGSRSKTMELLNQEVQRQKLKRPVRMGTFERDRPNSIELQSADPRGINGHFPRKDNGEAKDFDHLVLDGPGVDKLAALKIDIDKLGDVFLGRTDTEYRALSEKLTYFFNQTLLNLIKVEKPDQTYVVFAGGDDCFLIGRWNVLFDLAGKIQQAFRQFQQKEIKPNVSSLTHEITLSAGLVVVTPTYPMIRLGEEAEVALHAAKTGGRNRVTVFGQILTWQEFSEARKIADQLQTLIEVDGESRAILEFVKNSELGFDRLQQKAQNGNLPLPKVWKLKYYLRNVTPKNRDKMSEIFKSYEKALVQTFMNPKSATTPAVFPVAARWAELLTRSNNDVEPLINE